jgi:peptidyl-tRNA hydrolase
VLKKPSASDIAEIERAIDEGSQVFDAVVDGRFEEAMLRLHTRPDVSDAAEQKE